MNSLFIFAAQEITSFALSKGLNKIFSTDDEYRNRLQQIIYATIEKYKISYPTEDNAQGIPFYETQIFIEEIVKLQLFSINKYSFDYTKIQKELERNPNIITPTIPDLSNFFQLLEKSINADDKFAQLKIEALHKNVIFDIHEKVESIQKLISNQLIEIVTLLETEYKEEIDDCYKHIKDLKFNVALERLTSIEERVLQNDKHVTNSTKASLMYLKGICHSSLHSQNAAFKNYITAYKLVPEYIKYQEKACLSYYFLKNPYYQKIKSTLEQTDDFNQVCWAIETFESHDPINSIINIVPKIVLQGHDYQRLVFNHFTNDAKLDANKLIDALRVCEIDPPLPNSISYGNFHYWIYVNKALLIQYFHNTEIPFCGFLKKDEKAIQILEIAKRLSDAISIGEIEPLYSEITYYYYWLQSELGAQSDTISNLKLSYLNIKEPNSFKLMLYANSLQKHENVEIALSLLNDYNGIIEEDLSSLKTYCQLQLQVVNESVLDYFKIVKHVNNRNIQTVCSYLLRIIDANILDKETIVETINRIEYSKEHYKQLVNLLIDSLHYREYPIELEKINKLQSVIGQEDKLRYFVALIYSENDYINECIDYQKTYVNEDKESRDLLQYVFALNRSKSRNQLDLLRIVTKWRKNFTFNSFLLKIEIEIQQILNNWTEIRNITEYGLTVLNEDETFLCAHIISLAHLGQGAKISAFIAQLKSFQFGNDENAIRIVSVLIQENYIHEALDMLYNIAAEKGKSRARAVYFSLPVTLPEEYFSELQQVVNDCYVKYEIEGEVKIIHVNDNTINQEIVQKSIGKKPLDTFTIDSPFSRKLKNVKVLRVMNKYLALLDEIVTEVQSPFSPLPVESIKFDSNTKADIEKAIIENFGTAEDERRRITTNNLNNYNNYGLSFSELVKANFDGAYIDAYYHLTSSESDGYRVKPIALQHASVLHSDAKIVIDYSSALIFFELSKQIDLEFPRFIVPQSLYSILQNHLSIAEDQKKSNLSLSIFRDRVVPHLYPNDFHDNRIKFLITFRDWLKEHTETKIPEEKVDVMRPLYSQGKIDYALEYMVDTVLLAQRDNHLLISDDYVYEKLFANVNWASSEKYLLHSFPKEQTRIVDILLINRYIGIYMDSESIYNSYLNRNKEGLSHIYNYALRNLSILGKFDVAAAEHATIFLRKLAISSSIPINQYKIDATNIFAFIVSGRSDQAFLFTIKNQINKHFRLLGQYLKVTLMAYSDAIRITLSK